jgi:hypothetical protein
MNIPSKLKAVSNVVTSKGGLQVLKLQKHGPTIGFVAGATGMVATVILASRATLHLDTLMDEHDHQTDLAHEVRASRPDEYSAAAYKSDLTKINVKTALKITKLYGPATFVGAASLACLAGAHVTLSRRNAGLLAAYATVSKGFQEYRERVLADVGEEKEREYYQGTREVEVYSEKKNGEPVVKREKRSAGRSPYARLFGPDNPNWELEPAHRHFFLKAAQTSLQNQLMSKGWVTLNDVYDQLGMDRTKAGMVVGWVKGNGDDVIDFGIWDDDRMEEFHNFMTGQEDSIVLDFNVDGAIHDKI